MVSSKDRIFMTINHQEPDRVPLDIGGTIVTGVRQSFYRKLLDAWAESCDVHLLDHVQQLALLNEDFLEKLFVDTKGFLPEVVRKSPNIQQVGDWLEFVDEWGVKWKMPKVGGMYFSALGHPLSDARTLRDVERYPWPPEPNVSLLPKDLLMDMSLAQKEKFVILESYGSGIFETALRLRGYEQFLLDLALSPKLAEAILDKILETKMKYIDVLRKVADGLFHCIREGDDLATQESLIISRDMYRKFLLPRHKQLFAYVKRGFANPPFVFFHSCGAVYPLITEFIEAGIDILNPIQFQATGMDSLTLKKTFGQSVVFWGGGVDTQHTLPRCSPQEVREEVKRQIEILAPGGGFVFAAVHNIQEDVSLENFFVMWQTWYECSNYRT